MYEPVSSAGKETGRPKNNHLRVIQSGESSVPQATVKPEGSAGDKILEDEKAMNHFKKSWLMVAAFALMALGMAFAGTQKNPMVGGQPMYANKTIVENAVNSADHTTLVTAVKAAGLVDTLNSAGPFTVFAPTNEAFGKLPAGTVDNLVKPENKDTLTKVLT